MPFVADRLKGGEAERFTQQILNDAGIDASLNDTPAKYLDYDLIATVNGRQFTLETKFDIYEAMSGNVAIEFYNPKLAKPSGIAATKADLWVHVLRDKQGRMSAWVAPVKTLRAYLKSHKPSRVIACGGDSNASLYLYRREIIFADIFHPLEEDTLPLLLRLLDEC